MDRLLYQARNAPREVETVHCKCGIDMYTLTGVIIIINYDVSATYKN